MADRVVIMSRGQIEQIGTPEEIYHEPHNKFVAEFLGSANIFDGKLIGKTDNYWIVENEDGQSLMDLSAAPHNHIGDNLAYIVSSEKIDLNTLDSGVDGILATVVGEEFVGASAILFLETPSGKELKVQKSHDEIRAVNATLGSKLIVNWSPEICHVLQGE